MGTAVRASFALAVSLLLSAAVSDAQGGDTMPATPKEAMDRALPVLEAARKAKPAETPALVKDIRRTVDILQPHVTKSRADDELVAVWNEALTLTRFHGNQPTGAYVMEPQEAVGGCILFGIPKRRGWTFTAAPGDQYYGEVQRTLPDGRVAASVRIFTYDFNVTYSGIGGENAKGMAEHDFEQAKDGLLRMDSRSPRVLAKQLSSKFNRAHFFEVCGVDEKLGLVRKRLYHTKGSVRSYAFHVVEFREVKPTDDAYLAWQKSVSDPELEAVLETFEEGDPRKPRRK